PAAHLAFSSASLSFFADVLTVRVRGDRGARRHHGGHALGLAHPSLQSAERRRLRSGAASSHCRKSSAVNQMSVSRETMTIRRLRRGNLAIALAALATLALLAAACGAPPGPSGWAGPQPVKVDSGQLVLVPHKSKLFALPAG